MKTLLIYLPAFACLAMAAIICLPMLLKHGKRQPDPEVAELRAEVARLRAELGSRGEEVSVGDG